MEAKISKFFDSVCFFFGGGDQIPWHDREIIAGFEREVAAANGTSEECESESIMGLSWALVHSRQAEDVNRGIAMLEASLTNEKTPLQRREKLYLLAFGCFRNGNYSKSKQFFKKYLEMEPDWRQALSLKTAIEDRISKNGIIGIGIAAITATAVGLIVDRIAAALARKS